MKRLYILPITFANILLIIFPVSWYPRMYVSHTCVMQCHDLDTPDDERG